MQYTYTLFPLRTTLQCSHSFFTAFLIFMLASAHTPCRASRRRRRQRAPPSGTRKCAAGEERGHTADKALQGGVVRPGGEKRSRAACGTGHCGGFLSSRFQRQGRRPSTPTSSCSDSGRGRGMWKPKSAQRQARAGVSRIWGSTRAPGANSSRWMPNSITHAHEWRSIACSSVFRRQSGPDKKRTRRH